LIGLAIGLKTVHKVVHMTGNEQKKGQAETYPAYDSGSTDIGSPKVMMSIGGMMP